MKGNGTASVPRGPVPARPAPQPHPKDEDTLVQMAEHIPAGTRTPMCAHCNMVIRWVWDTVPSKVFYKLRNVLDWLYGFFIFIFFTELLK